jgi:hypothetical protein
MLKIMHVQEFGGVYLFESDRIRSASVDGQRLHAGFFFAAAAASMCSDCGSSWTYLQAIASSFMVQNPTGLGDLNSKQSQE